MAYIEQGSDSIWRVLEGSRPDLSVEGEEQGDPVEVGRFREGYADSHKLRVFRPDMNLAEYLTTEIGPAAGKPEAAEAEAEVALEADPLGDWHKQAATLTMWERIISAV